MFPGSIKLLKISCFRETTLIKRVAIKTNNENDWKLYKSSRNAANIVFRNAKREYYATKFLNNKTCVENS
jgi:hypothetical protein